MEDQIYSTIFVILGLIQKTKEVIREYNKKLKVLRIGTIQAVTIRKGAITPLA
jgi:hypothetical protein